MWKAVGSRIVVYVILVGAAVLSTGCVIPGQQAVKTGDLSPRSGDGLSSQPPGAPQGLIKPTIPEEPQPAVQAPAAAQPHPSEPTPADVEPRPDMPVPPKENARDKPAPSTPLPESQVEAPRPEPRVTAAQPSRIPKPFVETGAAKSPEKREWEDQKIREAAMEMAKGLPQVSKIKVCYAVKDDEWWVTFYDNAGAFTELKQYTWNRDLEKLEAFLVLKRIPSSRVQQHLTEEEPGKACDVFQAQKVSASQ